jgi:aspartyl-tRNA(Asn)/glutamyl-tRNA(Gln) amidotransferase subunit A
MGKGEIARLSLAQLSQKITAKQVSPVEALDAVFERIDEADGALNAHLTLCRDEARKEAREAERRRLKGEYLGPLHGVPLGLKDIIATKGVRTTMGSQVFADWVPGYDATVARRLKDAGAVVTGKQHCHEFAWSHHNKKYGPVRNPWDQAREPGGSSSGTGAAVASYMCYGGIGSDTGGSIRIPASLCGIVGLKPTYGRVSRYGVFPLSWSLDHLGPMTRTVEDTAIILQAIAGPDDKDPTTQNTPTASYYAGAMKRDIKGVKLGVPTEHFFDHADKETKSAIDKALGTLEKAGAVVEEVKTPMADYIIPAWWAVIASEIASVHEPYLKKWGRTYTESLLNVAGPGRFLPAATVLKAQRARSMITRAFNELLRRVDVLITPASPIPAWPLGGMLNLGKNSAESIGVVVSCTGPFNLTGLPSMSVPCGLNKDGLPLGMQISGRAFDEGTVLRVGYAYEQLSPFLGLKI